ncbi:carboxypeptidase-like regulatory domain-containing protein [Chryseobacterium gallinarum]|uniref:Carboxypeptidase regulatory-like domain-containing protein n=1 Tax=Chryseobacterium gallinarum TaxID=1324352 RepID=A0ABX6KRF3_CHRGL|nr:carboxypeptidase-like regulatory domain-containing protein [Chryseobacterium gallinarum]QIY91201.1 carboxypeptidase regulatory-like domain-containing protein [Chryseobacterium gallinarum]
MKLKLFFFLFLIFCTSAQAQSYIFGKVTSEDGAEMQDVTVINIRTDEMTMSNRDGHFMISGRAGDELRFVKAGYDRLMKKVTPENVQSPLNIILVRGTIQIPEVAVKQGITGNLKIDSRNFGPSRKVEKLTKEIDRYIAQKTDPRVLAARPGEFVQPKGQGFSIGKVKDKWDDVDLMKYLRASLGDEYFTDLKIEKPQIDHFIYYVFAGGFERKKILKYGFCSDADLNRFQRFVLTRISSYRAPQTQR